MRFATMVFTVLFLSLTGLFAFAQGLPVPSSAIADWISAHLGMIATVGGVLSELVMRIIPSSQPMSWLYGLSQLLKWADQLVQALAGALDAVLQNSGPQPPAPPAPPAA